MSLIVIRSDNLKSCVFNSVGTAQTYTEKIQDSEAPANNEEEDTDASLSLQEGFKDGFTGQF